MSDERTQQLISEAKALRLTRRSILRRASALGLSAAAAGTVLGAVGKAAPQRVFPTVLQGTSLNILASTAFVPAAQDHFAQQAQTFGEENGVNITVDFVNWPDLQPRTTSAVQAGAGPDIIEMWDTIPYLFAENLVDLSDIAPALEEVQGGYFDWVVKTASVDGQWRSIPYGTSSIAFAYRKSWLEEAGYSEFPKTWEELFEMGKALKANGHLVGQALGQSLGDPPGFCYPYMWSYGAMEVEEDGTTVAFNKPEFVEGMNTFIQAWKDAYDETGLSWDDAVNNRAFLSDQISATFNGSSIYIAAETAKAGASTTDYEIVVDPADIWHADIPGGPAGRFNLIGSRSFAIMSYSENQEAAKEFLTWWFQREQFIPWLEAQEGYIILFFNV